MDAERQIRFLFPPLFLMASLAWGIFLDDRRHISEFLPVHGTSSADVVAIVAGGGVVVTSLGFLINTISWALSRFGAWLFRRLPHEAVLPPEVLSQLRTILGHNGVSIANEALFLSATFDHGTLDAGIHKWILRRWNAFNLNASVPVALALALFLGGKLHLYIPCEWMLQSLAISSMFTLMAYWAWRDTMRMIEFQVRLKAGQQDSRRRLVPE